MIVSVPKSIFRQPTARNTLQLRHPASRAHSNSTLQSPTSKSKRNPAAPAPCKGTSAQAPMRTRPHFLQPGSLHPSKKDVQGDSNRNVTESPSSTSLEIFPNFIYFCTHKISKFPINFNSKNPKTGRISGKNYFENLRSLLFSPTFVSKPAHKFRAKIIRLSKIEIDKILESIGYKSSGISIFGFVLIQ